MEGDERFAAAMQEVNDELRTLLQLHNVMQLAFEFEF